MRCISKRALATVIGILLLWCGVDLQAQGQETYKVRLAPVPTDISMRANIAGGGTATAVLSGNKLTISGKFEGLRSPATVARLHRGMAIGVRGSAFQELTVDKAVAGVVSGAIELTPDQIQSLRKGQIYIQIHSEKAPEGNLWGWLLRQER